MTSNNATTTTKEGVTMLHKVTTGLLAISAVLVMGCGSDKTSGGSTYSSGIPTRPTPVVGQATISGLVLDGDGNVVPGASVKVSETDAIVTSDVAGAYRMTVPSDSTLTLVTSAAGFATTYRESIVLANGSAVTGFDVPLLASDKLAAMNGTAVTDVTTHGVMAVRLHALTDTCVKAGAHLSVFPPKAGTIVYSRPGGSVAMDQPDTAMDGVQAGANVDAWLLGALPPGSMWRISVDQPGCQLIATSPSDVGLVYPGQRSVAAQAMTVADLFLQ